MKLTDLDKVNELRTELLKIGEIKEKLADAEDIRLTLKTDGEVIDLSSVLTKGIVKSVLGALFESRLNFVFQELHDLKVDVG